MEIWQLDCITGIHLIREGPFNGLYGCLIFIIFGDGGKELVMFSLRGEGVYILYTGINVWGRGNFKKF